MDLTEAVAGYREAAVRVVAQTMEPHGRGKSSNLLIASSSYANTAGRASVLRLSLTASKLTVVALTLVTSCGAL
jgi:hypothetical protein